MKVLIVGHLGNMGRRYAAICDYLGIEWEGKDADEKYLPKGDFTHCIIASPTERHLSCIDFVHAVKGHIPTLCEKPIVKGDIPTWIDHRPLFMVNNYAHIPQVRQDALRGWRNMDTTYSYYNTGGDGTYWDCIQLIHLAKGSLEIDIKSPVWYCKINGTLINRAQVDHGYVEMIKDFTGPQLNLWGYNDIMAAHEKVEAFAKTNSLYCENVPQVHEAARSSSADLQPL